MIYLFDVSKCYKLLVAVCLDYAVHTQWGTGITCTIFSQYFISCFLGNDRKTFQVNSNMIKIRYPSAPSYVPCGTTSRSTAVDHLHDIQQYIQ